MYVGAETSVWGVVLYLLLTAVVIASMLLVPAVLGQRHRERTTGERYESGLPPASELPRRYSIEFYLVAMLFVVFDLESAFVFAWAVVARRVGWSGYIEMLVFILLLLATLAYLWRRGALEWGAAGRRKRRGRGLS
jgi:NADH-quinone oxidoreductase subunit A